MMHTTITKKQSNLLMLIDFKKAFDSISHAFIFSTLRTLGFGPDIINFITLFLTNRKAKILAGGHLTDTINLQQGVPQGDIIFPYLFLLMVEILLIKITKNVCNTLSVRNVAAALILNLRYHAPFPSGLNSRNGLDV